MLASRNLIDQMMIIIRQATEDVYFILGADSPTKSPSYDGNELISGDDGSSVLIVDQYAGRHPYIIDREFATRGQSVVKFCPTLLLDSNVASSFSRNLQKSSDLFLPGASGALLFHLLEKFNKNQIEVDVNPLFYCLESAIKSDPSMCVETVKGILLFQTCDKVALYNTGQLKICPEIMELYKKAHGTYDLSVIAKNQIDAICTTSLVQGMKKQVDILYICLMQIVILRNKNWPLEKKFEALYESFLDTLKLIPAKMLILGIHYFSGFFNRFFAVEKNTDIDRAIKNLRRSAWDMALLSLPESMLNKDSGGVVNIAYVCTAEKNLKEIAKLYTIRYIVSSNLKWLALNRNILQADYSLLNKLDDQTMAWLSGYSKKKLFERLKDENSFFREVTIDSDSLIEKLEKELSLIFL
jgi:hypothetical protein